MSTNMCKKKIYTSLIMIGVMILLSLFSVSSTVQAKSNVKLKVISVKQKKDKIFIKIKISNHSKEFLEISDEIVLYEKRNHKWKRIKWNEKHCTSDALFGLEAGTSWKHTFILTPEELKRKISHKKSYRIGIEVDGKYRKTKKIKFKKKAL